MTQILTEQAIDPAVRAWTRLLRASVSTTRLLSADLQERYGLTINDYEALLVLSHAENGRLKRVELARSLLLTDLRVTYAQLTDVGYDRLEAASEGHVASIRALFEEHFTREEIDAIAEILGKLPGVAEGDNSCSLG
jgi:hypothetical protein